MCLLKEFSFTRIVWWFKSFFIFFRDGSFKSIIELTSSLLIDDNLLYAIVSSDVYLQEFSSSSFSTEELEIVKRALKYREHIEDYKVQANNNYYEYKKQGASFQLKKVQQYIEVLESKEKSGSHCVK